MKTAFSTLLAATLLAGCAGMASLQTDTAVMPENQYGGPVMNQNDAIAVASWALKDPATTRGNPELAARAIAAEDWLAGQTQLTPDFGNYAPANEVFWGQLRRQVRASVGIAPGAPSQSVVNALIVTADALKAGSPNPGAALQPPAFTLGPDGTLKALANLPAFPARQVAFVELGRHENRPTGNCLGPTC
jgi:hypothetical protein